LDDNLGITLNPTGWNVFNIELQRHNILWKFRHHGFIDIPIRLIGDTLIFAHSQITKKKAAQSQSGRQSGDPPKWKSNICRTAGQVAT